MGLINYDIVVNTKEMENTLLCMNQTRSDGMIIEDIPSAYEYINTLSFPVIFEEQDIKFSLDKFRYISYLQVRYHMDGDMDEYQRLIMLSPSSWISYHDNDGLNINGIKVYLKYTRIS